MKKRLFSIMLVIIMTAALLPLNAAADTVSATGMTEEQIRLRIDNLYSLLGGKYFNVGQDEGCGSKSNGHACEGCFNEKIVEAEWFAALFGKVSPNQFPLTYTESSYIKSKAYSCAGFASFAEWYIFRSSEASTVTTTKIGTFSFGYETAEETLKVGDLVRFNDSHSAVVISVSEDGVRVIDSNWVGDYNCMVSEHNVKFSSYSSFTVSRVPYDNSLDSPSDDTVLTDTRLKPGTYKVNDAAGLNVRSGPGTGYDKLTAVGNGTVLQIFEISGTWGRTIVNGRTGWVSMNYLVKTDHQHYALAVGAVAPTCTKSGSAEGTVCALCGETLSGCTEIKALGHSYSGGVCTRCGSLENTGSNPFTDVSESSVYYNAVLWAYYHNPQITAGVDGTNFCPQDTCTRGQAVTFLWRAAGCPEPTIKLNPYTDVSASSGFYKAIIWATEQGITSGYGDGIFGVSDSVSRAQFVTFLWRAEGSPSVGAYLDFSDVPSTSPFYKAVSWAVANGITAGYGDEENRFGTNDACKRMHVVMFLYRYSA